MSVPVHESRGGSGDAFGVKPSLTGGRPRRRRRRRRRERVENDTYLSFCRRIIAAAGRRIAAGDVESLPDLIELQNDLDRALGVAVAGLREFGYSWGEIASRTGTSRQAAQQRWGRTAPADPHIAGDDERRD